MSQHSILPPSSAARRVACPGSRSLEALYPQSDSAASIEGTKAHKIAALYLDVYPESPYINDNSVTPEMTDGAKLYAEWVRTLSRNVKLHIEERVDISVIHPDCWGTVDCWFIRDDTLYVCDYKYGHKFVDAWPNYQLIEYAAGILNTNPAANVEFVIVQPRGYGTSQVRRHRVATQELIPYFTKLRDAEAEAMSDSPMCRPNPLCGYCSARAHCTALQRACYNILETQAVATTTPLDDHALGLELGHLQDARELLDARLTGLEAEVEGRIRNGASVYQYALESGGSREKWSQPADEVILAGKMFGVDLEKSRDVITPTQARKTGLSEDVIISMTERVPGAMKLKRHTGNIFKNRKEK